MHNRHGFLLIEWLVYCMIIAFVALCTALWLSNCYIPIIKDAQASSAMVDVWVAHDLMIRDLRNAEGDLPWKTQKIATSEYVWKMRSSSVGWAIHNKKLIRTEGDFNGIWRSSSRAIVARGMSSFGITGDHALPHLVTCWLENDKGVRVERTVFPMG